MRLCCFAFELDSFVTPSPSSSGGRPGPPVPTAFCRRCVLPRRRPPRGARAQSTDRRPRCCSPPPLLRRCVAAVSVHEGGGSFPWPRSAPTWPRSLESGQQSRCRFVAQHASWHFDMEKDHVNMAACQLTWSFSMSVFPHVRMPKAC